MLEFVVLNGEGDITLEEGQKESLKVLLNFIRRNKFVTLKTDIEEDIKPTDSVEGMFQCLLEEKVTNHRKIRYISALYREHLNVRIRNYLME